MFCFPALYSGVYSFLIKACPWHAQPVLTDRWIGSYSCNLSYRLTFSASANSVIHHFGFHTIISSPPPLQHSAGAELQVLMCCRYSYATLPRVGHYFTFISNVNIATFMYFLLFNNRLPLPPLSVRFSVVLGGGTLFAGNRVCGGRPLTFVA